MIIPGSNILNVALSALGKQTVSYTKYLDRRSNEVGFLVPVFAPAVPVVGSLQPIPRTKYEYLGLDYTKDYYNFYTSSPVLDLQRNVAGDRFEFADNLYQCEAKTAWENMDGWCSVLCIRIDKCAS